MDLGDFNDSSVLDDGHRPLPKWSSQPRSLGEELEQTSSDSHEHFHTLHIEAMERAAAAGEEGSLFDASRAQPKAGIMSRNPLEQAILEMRQRILLLESQLTSSSSNEDHPRATDDTEITDPRQPAGDLHTAVQEGIKDVSEQMQIKPEIRMQPWSDFMNKLSEEEHDCAIEVLIGEPQYRQPAKGGVKFDRKMSKSRTLNLGSKTSADPVSTEGGDEAPQVPERIRINSPWILNALAAIDKTLDPTGPIVMLRPFKFLVQHERQIEDSIHVLESQNSGSHSITLPKDSTESSASKPSSDTLEMTALSQGNDNRQITLQHMRCLADFIDHYIRPTINRLNDSSTSKIRFSDLWYIFKPGEDIYMPIRIPRGTVSLDTAISTPEMFQDRYNMMWRCTGAGGGRRNPLNTQSSNAVPKYNPFKVNCYYIEFDGKYFLPTIHTFSIMPFKGERDITSLNLFPMRFLKDAEKTKLEHFSKGKMVFDNVTSLATHYYYSGPTLTAQPCGCPIQKEHLHQEHIESEVIADFRVALINHPSWRPKPSIWKAAPVERRELHERHPVHYWNSPERTQLENTEYDHVYDDSLIDEERATAFKIHEPIFTPIPSDWLSNENMVPEKDVALTTSRIYAFVLRTRTFAPLWLWLLQPIKPQKDGLRNLQLRDDSFKDTIQALVRTHFIQENTQQKSDFEYDVVRGKGKGLIILLHGAPGVGKSFTAESVAAANGRPLFQITCGDLGLTPAEVEKTLKEVFRYAQLWNCVLLLDECDIFLAQRSKTDIKRNSLVSVFLRVLEFYTGVLFLTTNRVGVLDDAIKSRITFSAYYPPLDKQQTTKIWKVNIKLLEERNKRLQVDTKGILKFAKEHFMSSTDNGFTTWNGRQIQNAFKVATALAEWDAYTQDVQHNIDTRVPEEDLPNQPRLLPDHFKTIAEGAQAFDDYLREATGYTEAERAFNAMERADEYMIAAENNVYGAGNGSGGLFLSPDHDSNRRLPPFTSSPASIPHQRRPSVSSKTFTTSPLSRDAATTTNASRRRSTSGPLQHQHSPNNLSSSPHSPSNAQFQNHRRLSGQRSGITAGRKASYSSHNNVTVSPPYHSSPRPMVNGRHPGSGHDHSESDSDLDSDEEIDRSGGGRAQDEHAAHEDTDDTLSSEE